MFVSSRRQVVRCCRQQRFLVIVLLIISAITFSSMSIEYWTRRELRSSTRINDVLNHDSFEEEDGKSERYSVSRSSVKDYSWNHSTTERKKRFPSCIIIGAKKSGTGALKEYLEMHPAIEVARSETHFFDIEPNYSRGLLHYKEQMPFSFPNQTTIEKTPRYWVYPSAAARIYQMNKNIQLIVTLRHPVHRMISDYWQIVRRSKSCKNITPGTTNQCETFEKLAIDQTTGEVNTNYEPLIVSMYYTNMIRWLQFFKEDQIHIVDGDNLIVNPVEEIEKIETFLSLEHKVTRDLVYFDHSKGFYCMKRPNKEPCLVPSKGHNHPPVDPIVYQKLMDFFAPLNEQFFSLVRRRFNWN